ncbi:exonuclease V a 5' deoxyribonuclease-domain-containing protein [Fusarium flagelliforme]|uniref:Putative exonuclease v n=1 Tax=Fusarium flagelliforme TaxID=2675880 RepID=A0A395N078_9HYPO|nr:exonuclease V a 5' deoxyribonuclease-domain-containing protein [Fusarium flagelliforme]KAH7198207.1 exonuclease V a 5' deoxyribonuclease-domain-containing protein [Fusarium flagelliforme]RFN53574.1 putative exonuclease v [Fusarium flagelliforme]
MASTAAMTLDSDNEFGYEFDAEEEELLFQLASQNDHTPQNNARLAAIDAVPERTDRVFDQDDLSTIGASEYTLGRTETGQSSDLYRGQAFNQRESSSGLQTPPVATSNEDVYYPDLSKALTDLKPKSPLSESTITAGRTSEANQDESYDDGRSPIQRFRSYPKRPLTVTDLTSGAWCELQYWYTLTRLPGGRRTRTAAMKKGSKIHKKLEDEVHTTVKIDIMTKEDAFGLRLWNLVQGLRTLRDRGLTRELEVWGMVDENLVNGVIDSVSYENPNPEFEAELSSQESETSKRQSSLTDYFPPKKGVANHSGPKIYLADVKTRGSTSPVSNAQIRPAKIQLLLYHHFLSEMAAGKLDFLKVFRRYGLDVDDAFSDTFIAQIGSLHDEIFVDASETETEFTQDNPSSSFRSSSSIGPDLLQYRTLRELIPLVQEEIDLAFPYGEHSMGHMLRVQYVHRDDGREIDLHDFPVSKQALETYLSNYMEWWKGRREAKGVDIEEAFKCRTCEFVDDCSWRQSMDEEMLQKARNSQKKRATRRASNNAA